MRSLIGPLMILAIACGDGTTGTSGAGQFTPTAPCVGGEADGYACERIDLLARVPVAELESEATSNFSPANDIWGWTDSETGRHYALVGRQNGVSIVDVTDPLDPAAVGRLPSAVGESIWRDVKVYRDHAYVVADFSPGHGVQVLDLRRLRGVTEFTVFSEDARYDGVSSARNIVINEESGFAYAVGSHGGGTSCGGGLHMIDIRDPKQPTFAGCFADPSTGVLGTGYTHDAQCIIYDGPDQDYHGREICLGANETALSIADVTDKAAPVAISTATYPEVSRAHQGWLTPDRRYFLLNDELDEHNGLVARTRTLVWDVTDLDDPVLATEYFGPTDAVDHNIYVRESLAYLSNTTFGLRVLDIRNPRQPAERGFFDTHPDPGQSVRLDAGSSSRPPGIDGCWSNYPFFDNGVIAVSSSRDGLFLLQLGG